MFRPHRRLRPIAFPDLRYYPWTLNTSAEAPYRESKYWQEYIRQKQREGEIDDDGMTFHNLYNEIFHENRIHVHSIKYGMEPFWKDGEPVPYHWTYLHSRSHLVSSNKPDKIRAVFGVPKLLLMVENMFIWNLQKEYLIHKNGKGPLLWGFETIRGGWRKLIGKLSQNGEMTRLLSADWSGFDHKALHEVIDDVHQIWRSWFDFDQGYEPSESDEADWTQTQSEEWKIQNLWDWMTHSVKHSPI